MSAIKTEPKPDPFLSHESPAETRSEASALSASKRKLEQDIEPTDTKRIKREEASQPAPDNTPPLKKSTDFWYPDGNVVIVVGDTAFKLYQARLARFSAIFTAWFEDEGSEKPRRIEGCPVYDVAGLTVEDFEPFLAALETPFKFASVTPPEPTLISILRASTVLSCPTARDLAVGHLRTLWPADDATLASGGGQRPHASATAIILISRDCAVPELRRRAFYELLRSHDFWAALDRQRTDIPLPDADIIALCRARSALQEAWCTLAFTPPFGGRTGEDGKPLETSCGGIIAVPVPAAPVHGFAPQGQGMPMRRVRVVSHAQVQAAQEIAAACGGGRLVAAAARKGAWRSDMIDRGDFERGRRDPIGTLQFLLMERKATFAEAGWCEKCMQERRKAWADAQVKWWGLLDRWFKN
ncbi:hypothetical protein GSI_08454 [Ganoderma sinense ZZ0214-1]|uniref:BTB domain-containing protein n=1 Tax=Ganoderma sinense ZZ0214-1 TaxID=1077348 RepID=A0A2G8S3S0_9APHY|nr:hypothetical protein GSI_08454 [Ganoderma sinense ZZ0214-1]